ncbi:hypothetical protein [Burkholderia dolosa]|uniref:hypothetical protein n=1 Tax=Burkholderia dolosa TaxID=152500 RepID=UPI001BA67416|nr:hypothetical protein [Burkholderia dolosa]
MFAADVSVAVHSIDRTRLHGGNIDDRKTRPAVMILNANATAFAARVPIAIHPIDRVHLPAATSMTAKRGLP